MANVRFCNLYKEICTRDWCKKHKGKCGGGGSCEMITKQQADKRITEYRYKQHIRSIERAVEKVKENPGHVKKMGYRLTKI